MYQNQKDEIIYLNFKFKKDQYYLNNLLDPLLEFLS